MLKRKAVIGNKSKHQVFYSWQSDTPKRENLNAIRSAIDDAIKQLNVVFSDAELVRDEATRGTSGSPNIAVKILEKIDRASIFVADITTITPKGQNRACPNPNVVYELGYAVATLGWDRIILLFNKEIGNFPADLPFDIIQNRASPYSCTSIDEKTKVDDLTKLLKLAIKAVVDKNPKRPAETKGLSREKIQHERDLENIKWLMESIHLPTLQVSIEEMPHIISDKAIWFFEGFKGVVSSNLFNIHDSKLNSDVRQLFEGWVAALSQYQHYHDTPNGKLHVFTNPMDMPLIGRKKSAWNKVDKARKKMAHGLNAILERLRSDYLEINIHETSSVAWNSYVSFVKELSPKKKRPKKAVTHD